MVTVKLEIPMNQMTVSVSVVMDAAFGTGFVEIVVFIAFFLSMIFAVINMVI